jgi:hypothetical protein
MTPAYRGYVSACLSDYDKSRHPWPRVEGYGVNRPVFGRRIQADSCPLEERVGARPLRNDSPEKHG